MINDLFQFLLYNFQLLNKTLFLSEKTFPRVHVIYFFFFFLNKTKLTLEWNKNIQFQKEF